MAKLTIEAHSIDADFQREIEQTYGVTITDRTREPWCVVFTGERDKLIAMVADHWDADRAANLGNALCDTENICPAVASDSTIQPPMSPLTPNSVGTSPKPLRTEDIFIGAPGGLAGCWANVTAIENKLAERLLNMPIGTAAINGAHAWFLAEQAEYTVLMHADFRDGHVIAPLSRFDFSLEWVDIEEDELNEYVGLVAQALSNFTTQTVAN